MKYKLTALTLILALSTILISPGLAAAEADNGNPHRSGSLALPITGTAADGSSVAGTFNLQRFAVQDGKLVAIGTLLIPNVPDPANPGAVRTLVAGGVALPVPTDATALTAQAVQAAATCNILHLVLGPLHLDLLGLVVDLNKVVLDITAQSGAGNLLGNLLCAVTNLLNQGGPLQRIANLLNQILQILGG